MNSRQKNEQIQLSEILVGIVAGSKGILCYNLPGLNGLSYHSLSQATSLLSDYENILFKGRRHQENVKVNGILGDAWVIFELNGNPEKVLIAYNNTSKTANLTVAFDSPVNGYEYFHGEKVTGKTIKSPIAPFDAVAYIIKSLSDNK